MTSTKQDLEKLMATLAQQRDELKLQMHLAKAEAKDEWNALEGKWGQAQGKLGEVPAAAGESLEDVRAAASLLAEELKIGYERIRKLF